MIQLYGIPNCATVKKARVWLEEQQLDYTFHDFKKIAPTPEFLATCLQTIPLDTLINKRGTTWRKLSPEQQAKATQIDSAIALMCEHPSVIKRPILVYGDTITVGFSAEQYAKLLA